MSRHTKELSIALIDMCRSLLFLRAEITEITGHCAGISPGVTITGQRSGRLGRSLCLICLVMETTSVAYFVVHLPALEKS